METLIHSHCTPLISHNTSLYALINCNVEQQFICAFYSSTHTLSFEIQHKNKISKPQNCLSKQTREVKHYVCMKEVFSSQLCCSTQLWDRTAGQGSLVSQLNEARAQGSALSQRHLLLVRLKGNSILEEWQYSSLSVFSSINENWEYLAVGPCT